MDWISLLLVFFFIIVGFGIFALIAFFLMFLFTGKLNLQSNGIFYNILFTGVVLLLAGILSFNIAVYLYRQVMDAVF